LTIQALSLLFALFSSTLLLWLISCIGFTSLGLRAGSLATIWMK
jgi:hypothetical protein